MGAPSGNLNALKGQKYVYDALRKAVVQDDKQRLDAGVQKVLSLASEGERWAIEFIRDTLDGKPAQSVLLGNENDKPFLVSKLERVIVDPQHSDS